MTGPTPRGKQHDQANARLPIRPVSAAMLCATTGVMGTMLAGALVVQISDDLALSEGAFGFSISVYFLISASVSIWTSRMADQIGWRRAALVSGLFSAISLLAIAAMATSYPLFLLAMAVGGIGQSIAMPTSNLAIIREVPSQRQRFAFGLKQTSNPFAGILAGLSIPAIAVTVGWRWAFAAGLVMPLMAAIVIGRPGAAPVIKVSGDVVRKQVAQYDRRPLVLLAVGGSLAGLSVMALNAFVVASAVQSGVHVARAGVYVAISSIVGLSMRVISGRVADSWSSPGLRPVTAMLAVGTLGFVLLATQQAALVLPGMLLAYGAGWGWPGLFHYGIAAYHPEAPASATGFVQVGVLIGSAAGPTVVGLLAASLGFRRVWLIVAVLGVAGAGIILQAARLLERRDGTGDGTRGSGRAD